MSADDPTPVTRLLARWREGDREALDRLMPIVRHELGAIARRYLKREPAGHTLQTTALVNEAYLKLVGAEVPWQDRAHFFAVAARAMRRILVDHARGKRRDKRGGGEAPVPLDEARVAGRERPPDVVALDEALADLERVDARKARALEMKFFAGMTYAEIATSLDLSEATVHRELRAARAWLKAALTAETGPDGP